MGQNATRPIGRPHGRERLTDGHRFDSLTRSFACATTRRAALRAVVGGLVGVGVALLGRQETTAATESDERPAQRLNPFPMCGPRRPPCPARHACINGRCVPCGPIRTACGNACVDPLTDRNNCGDCGIVCGPDEVCGLGVCGQSCNDNFDCPDDLEYVCTLGICVNGGCNIAPLECLFGQPKQDCCKTADRIFCVDFKTDPRHCGRCYNNCGDRGCCNGACC
jgi:hypothetical protein